MKTLLQTTLPVVDDQQLKRVWAFATSNQNFAGRVILSCSREARILGVRVGMRYEDAKTLLPDLRVMTIGGGHA